MKQRKNKELSSKDLTELVVKGMTEKKGLEHCHTRPQKK